jgi:hypothetical protein
MRLNTRQYIGGALLVAAFVAGFLVHPPALGAASQEGQGRTSDVQSSPAISLDPGSLQFGDQVVAIESPPQRVTVTNTGERPLYLNSVELRGEDWKEFRVVKETCTGTIIRPGRSCICDVSFVPAVNEDRAARLVLIDNAPGGPHEITLTGTGINSVDVPPF